MQYQNEKGIYVYFLHDNYVDDSASLELRCVHYETLEHFFWKNREEAIKENIGHSVYDAKCTYVIDHLYGRGYCGRRYRSREIHCDKLNCTEHKSKGKKVLVVYDENGKQYLPDVLVGMRRAWINDKKAKDYRNRYTRNTNGRKNKAYARHRQVRTFQERKWSEAWNDVDFAPKTRRARVNHNLPDLWDDFLCHNDKSWKTQSKRKKQWK